MQSFNLASEFVNPSLEQGVLAAIAHSPDLYWELLDDLPRGAFTAEAEAWKGLVTSIETEQPPVLSDQWNPADDPREAARHLSLLTRHRLWAESIDRQVRHLYETEPPSPDAFLEDEAARIREAARDLEVDRLRWGSDLLGPLLDSARERRRQREETGRAITGVSTGLPRLDQTLNGLGTGLYVLAGPPGVGKTTLSLQLAMEAASAGVPVVYITYENSPENLVQKALCARAGLTAGSIERGFADLARLERAAASLAPALRYLATVEGTSGLTLAQVRGRALQVKARHRTDRCLVVFDYLQRAAHGRGYDQLRHNVSALVGELRDMANRLESPVLAISSQNRSAGNYGNGGGSAALDSLKESGDLEYSADAILFLRPAPKRETTPPARPVDLVLGKNRYGDTGSIPLIFRPDLGDMREEVDDPCDR